MPHLISSAKFVQHTTSGIFTCTWRAPSCNTVGGAMWNHTCSECLPGKIALDAIYKNVQFRGPNLLLLKAMANFPLSAATFDPSGDPQKKQQWGSAVVLAAEAHTMVAVHTAGGQHSCTQLQTPREGNPGENCKYIYSLLNTYGSYHGVCKGFYCCPWGIWLLPHLAVFFQMFLWYFSIHFLSNNLVLESNPQRTQKNIILCLSTSLRPQHSQDTLRHESRLYGRSGKDCSSQSQEYSFLYKCLSDSSFTYFLLASAHP